MGCQTSAVDSSSEHVDTSHTPGRDFHREYILDCKLGQGAYGTVYAAKPAADEQGARAVAVKVIDLRPKEKAAEKFARLRSAVDREIRILRVLPRSANIVQFHGFYAMSGLAYLVMEKCSIGLCQALGAMPALNEQTMQPVFRDMLTGISACHAAGIAHRDIKPDNFLATPLAGGLTVKLCDFGLAARVSGPEATDLEGVFGTPPFMSPEMLGRVRYGAKVDIWAFGVIAYILLFGAWPYTPQALSGPDMKAAILAGTPSPRFESRAGAPKVSSHSAAWVKMLLRREALERPTAIAALRHPNFASTWRAGASMRQSLTSAKRWGAFGAEGSKKDATCLDRLMTKMNAEAREVDRTSCQERRSRWNSEASTSADSGASHSVAV